MPSIQFFLVFSAPNTFSLGVRWCCNQGIQIGSLYHICLYYLLVCFIFVLGLPGIIIVYFNKFLCYPQIMMKAEHFETTFPTCMLEPSTSQFRYAKYTSMIIYANIVNMICMYIKECKSKKLYCNCNQMRTEIWYMFVLYLKSVSVLHVFFHLSRVTSVINIFNITCIAQEPGDVPNHSPSSSFSSSLNSTFVLCLGRVICDSEDWLIDWLIDWWWWWSWFWERVW